MIPSPGSTSLIVGAVVLATWMDPSSWLLAALCAWIALGCQRGWVLDVWERRLMSWGLFSTLSFGTFLLSDPTFTGWSSVYFFCGDSMEYCTGGYRWNLRGWRKAVALWNFLLSTALALQQLLVEFGLGGLLLGEEVVTRESFVSVAWRLVPFWLNRWESTFGAECSSLIFEIPHFAVELLVVLPLVQILAGRLRIVAHPHLRADAARGRRAGAPPAPPGAAAAAVGAAGHGAPPAAGGAAAQPGAAADGEGGALAPNVLRCAWENDSAQRRLLPRLRANLRVMAMIALVTSIGAFNALVVPLALESQAARAPRSSFILALEPELSAVAAAGRRARAAEAAESFPQQVVADMSAEAAGEHGEVAERRWSAGSGGAGDGQGDDEEEVPWLAHMFQRPAGSRVAGAPPGAAPQWWVESPLVAHLEGAVHRRRLGSEAEERSQFLVSRHCLEELVRAERRAQRGNGSTASGAWLDLGKLEAMLLRPPAVGEPAKSMCSVEPPVGLVPPRVCPAAGFASAVAFADPAEATPTLRMLRSVQRTFLAKAEPAADQPGGGGGGGGAVSAALLYRNLHKHAQELRRMRDPGHMRMVPLVESALAIMRLSCERWFALVAVYVGYLLFRDPPPAARAVIRRVAWVSRTFQRAILLSFPAVCWAFGAGALFSSFASFIFWAGPLMKAVEGVRRTATIVRPASWHAATEAEVQRAGNVCAICWGGLDAAQQQEERGVAARPGEAAGRAPRAARAMGLACGHAYHQECILEWLKSCHGQRRTPTCPMCQGYVELHVRYRLHLGAALRQGGDGGDGEAAAAVAAEAEQEGGGGAGQHRRERGIPGLDVLVEELQDDFRHRFEPPVGQWADGWAGEAEAGPREEEEGVAVAEVPPAGDMAPAAEPAAAVAAAEGPAPAAAAAGPEEQPADAAGAVMEQWARYAEAMGAERAAIELEPLGMGGGRQPQEGSVDGGAAAESAQAEECARDAQPAALQPAAAAAALRRRGNFLQRLIRRRRGGRE